MSDLPTNKIAIHSPANGEFVGEVSISTADEVRAAVARGRAAQVEWAKKPVAARMALLLDVREKLLARLDEVVEVSSKENGKPRHEGLLHEGFAPLELLTYFGTEAERILQPQPIPLRLLKHRASYIHYVPRGVVAIIAPWNFPHYLAFGGAAMALVACPTGSIGTRGKTSAVRQAAAAFPDPVDGNIYFCGYASPDSYGAASYLIVRPEGNVLVDSPRYAKNLVARLEQLGGVSLMFLTHQDDVADHEKYHEHFGCERVMHRADARSTRAERLLEGTDPVRLDHELEVIPTPGHTRGHSVLLYRDKYLFSGDHLAWSDRRGGLVAFRDVAWYSWREQTESMKRLQGLRFEWVLPGHGRRAHLPTDEMQQKLRNCVEWMATV